MDDTLDAGRPPLGNAANTNHVADLVEIEIRLMEMRIGSRISRVWLLAKVLVCSLPICFFLFLFWIYWMLKFHWHCNHTQLS